MTVACLEPQFFKEFLGIFKSHVPLDSDSPLCGKSDGDLQLERLLWPALRIYLEAGFKLKTRDEWAEIFHGPSQIGHMNGR